MVNNNSNVQKLFPKLSPKITKNEYRTQKNKCRLTQNRYKGFQGKGFWAKGKCSFWDKRYTFCLGPKKPNSFGNTKMLLEVVALFNALYCALYPFCKNFEPLV